MDSVRPPSRALAEFVAKQKRAYLQAVDEGKGTEWTVAVGNEAGDLDSLASAIAYAWYATVEHSPTVPLVQTPRSELPLRGENLLALKLAGFDPANPEILCIDDIPPRTPFPSNKFALLDHNRLVSTFSNNNPDVRVIAVIDHHEDEGLYKDTANPRIILVPTGSTTSLVACLIRDNLPSPDLIPPELATLLLCGILIDTNGLKVRGKAEAVDHAAAAFLAPRSLLTLQTPDFGSAPAIVQQDDPAIRELAIVLRDEKASVSHLRTPELLRRDYKEYAFAPEWAPGRTVLVGLCSVPEGLKSWIARDPSFWPSIMQWMEEHKLAVLGILTSFRHIKKNNKSGKHRREQLFVVDDSGVPGLSERLFAGLEDTKELRLKRKDWGEDYGVPADVVAHRPSVKVRVWRQKNVDATRKVIAPVVRAIIEGSKGANL